MAKEWGIKIYTVGVGGNETGSVVQTPLGPYQMPGVAPLDESALKAISDATGGIYRRADDGDSLRSFYHEIDNLEKTEFDTDRFLDYREWFMPFAFAALALLILEAALSSTVFRRLP
jgi:Ca-activated chloride channel family protein